MIQPVQTVVGVDVGEEPKGFHAVALRVGAFVAKISDRNPAQIVDWCQAQGAALVAVDAPCGWSRTGSSRQAERDLKLFGNKIHSFATPARQRAEK